MIGSQLCSGHAGRGVAASPEAARAAQRRASSNRRKQADAAKKSAQELYREALQANAAAFADARVKCALDETVSWPERLKAMEALENRALGRPTEHVQTEDVSAKPEDLGMGELIKRLREHAEAQN